MCHCKSSVRVITIGMMLVPILILLQVAVFCQGKSLDYRGKRSYDHGYNPELHGNFYYPRVDGQPIYIPSMGQSAADMNGFMDEYYRKIKESAQAWPSATQFPVNYDEEGNHYYESPAMSNSMVKTVLGDTDEDGHRGGFHRFPTESQLNYHEYDPSYYTEPHMEYDLDDKREPPYLYDKYKPGYETSVPERDPELQYDGYKEPVVQGKTSVKKSGVKTAVPKPELEYVGNHYEQPVVADKINEKKSENKTPIKKVHSEMEYADYEEPAEIDRINVKKSGNKPPITSELEYVDDKTVVDKTKVKETGDKHSITKSESALEYNDYEKPVLVDKDKKSGHKPSVPKTDSESEYVDYEEPVVVEKNKKSGHKPSIPKTESELEYVDYGKPVLVDKSKKKSSHKPSVKTESESEYVDYEEPAVVDKNKNKSGHKPSVPTTELELEYVDYGKPVLVDKSKKKSIHKPSVPKTESESEYVDYEEPVVVDKNKEKSSGHKPSVPKTESELEYVDYEKPVLFDKSKKKSSHKPSVPKTESELEYVDYEEPVVVDRVNVKKSSNKPSSNKESELEYVDYEKPLVVERINVKKSGPKPNIPKSEGNYADDEYEQPVVHETVKDYKVKTVTKKDKPGKVSSVSYGGDLKETRSPNKKSNKGKRRKHTQPPKYYETSSEYPITVVKRENFEEYPVKEFIDESYTENYEVEEIENKHGPKEAPVKHKEKVVVKSEGKETAVKHKEKVVIKSETKTTVKNKDKVIKTKWAEAKKPPVKTENKVTASELDENFDYSKSEHADDSQFPEEELKSNMNSNVNEDGEGETENVLEDQTDKIFEFDHTNEHFNFENNPNPEFESSGNGPQKGGDNSINVPRFFPNLDALESLSSLNSNLWSLVFNPNAERQRSKRCITRNNETGYCSYVQHCEVPDIATSLEQLLRNACVIDDIFIGVCCPEFPVQTVKVHWEQDIPNSGKQTEADFGDSTDDCGIRSSEAAKVNSWPWKAPLISMSNGKIFCGGVVISEDYVLTAAHCTTKIPRNQILVRLGQYDDSTGEDYAVVEIKRHAQYNPRTMHNDVALLKLGRRIVKDHFTGVICVPDDDDTDEHDGKKAILLGWKGMFGTNSNKTEFLKVLEHKECGNKLPAAIPKTVLCTETRNEDERTCNADSGAPLVIDDDGKFEVIGILSWNRNDCDQRFPSTFSRVSSFAGWIRKHAV